MAFGSKKKNEQDHQAVVEATASQAAGAGVYEWPDPRKPSAFLVPTYVRENLAAAKTSRVTVTTVVAVSVAAVLGVGGAFILNMTADMAQTKVETQQAKLQSQVDGLKPIADYYDGLEERNKNTQTLLSADLEHDVLYKSAVGAFGPGTEISSYTTSVGTPCPGGNAFSPEPALGCLNITGRTTSQAAVAQAISSFNAPEMAAMFDDPFVASISNDDNGVQFTLTVNFNSQALSGKYTKQPTGTTAPTASAPQSSTTTPATPQVGTP
jgi:hypothetical protein